MTSAKPLSAITLACILGLGVLARAADDAKTDDETRMATAMQRVIALSTAETVSDRLKLCTALYDLDRLADALRISSEPADKVRKKARAALAKADVPARCSGQLLKLYSAGFLSFSERSAVHRGDSATVKEQYVAGDKLISCAKHAAVPGLYLYREQMELLLRSSSEAALVGGEQGSTFMACVDITEVEELDWLEKVIRQIWSLGPDRRFKLYYHEGGRGIIVFVPVSR